MMLMLRAAIVGAIIAASVAFPTLMSSLVRPTSPERAYAADLRTAELTVMNHGGHHDQHGNPLDSHGNPISSGAESHPNDNEVVHRDQDGRPVDASGNLLNDNEAVHRDLSGRPVDASGNLLDNGNDNDSANSDNDNQNDNG